MPGGVSLRVDGVERAFYNTSPDGPRPFFFPVVGPSGHHLTRIGHPGDPVGHGHHLSVWFAHEKLDGVNFWADQVGTDIQIRHLRTTCLQDGPSWAAFSADLSWWADGRPRLLHELIAAIEPIGDSFALDLQSRFTPPGAEPVELGQTNFGILGIRVAKTISELFGAGRLTSSTGATGEPAIFGHASPWVDYSGPVAQDVVEGIAYLDHLSNPRHPALWHVRRDGWMCASSNQSGPLTVSPSSPLTLRYRLLLHPGPADASSFNSSFAEYSSQPAYAYTPASSGKFPSITRC
jgi:hypothetical protein